MRAAAIYIRVSTDDQLEFSPGAQKRALTEYAQKNGYVIHEDAVFIDEGISGKKAEKRPAFMEMIKRAKTKPRPFDVILVHKFDRFARNREDSVVYKSLLRKECGIQVISVTERIEDDKFSVILEAMLEAMAEYYSLNLADEVKKGMLEKARRGGILTRAPYGYANTGDGKTPVIVPGEAEVVRMMFDKIYSGEMTPYTLARYLNRMAVGTRKGAAWSTFTVKYILLNAFYTGLSVWNRQQRGSVRRDESEWITAQGGHEPIIEQNVFDEVQRRLAASPGQTERQPAGNGHWLSGLVKCAGCGGSLSVSRQGKYPFFQCHHYNKGRCAVSHYVPVYTLEKAVLGALDDFLTVLPPSSGYEKRTESKSADGLALLRSKEKKAKEKLARVKAAYEAGVDTLEEYRENKNKITEEIAKLATDIKKRESSTLGEDMKKTKMAVYSVLDQIQSEELSWEEKNNALKSFISKIVFDKHAKAIDVYFYV